MREKGEARQAKNKKKREKTEIGCVRTLVKNSVVGIRCAKGMWFLSETEREYGIYDIHMYRMIQYTTHAVDIESYMCIFKNTQLNHKTI